MKYLILIAFVQTIRALPNYPAPSTEVYGQPTAEYAPEVYGKPSCTYVDEVTYTEKCEDYTDRICYTTYDEVCENVYDQVCRGSVTTTQTRPCYNVTENICALKEDVSIEVIDAVFTVQVCNRATERVCDTHIEMDYTTNYQEQCITVPSMVCNTEEKTYYEKTCRTETTHDCEYGQKTNDYATGMTSDYGKGASDYGGPNYAEKTPDYSKTPDYECKQHKDTRCTSTPRQAGTQTCAKREQRLCERISERVPRPVERKVCRDEDKKVCRVEQKTQPKQIKKYFYKLECRPLTRSICENVERRKLVPSCVPTTKQVCHPKPNERCEDVPKHYCHKVPSTVRKEKCEQPPAYTPHAHTSTYTK